MPTPQRARRPRYVEGARTRRAPTRLENELQAELHDARIIGAVDSAQQLASARARTGASKRRGTEASSVHAASTVSAGGAPLRVIPGVIGLPAELDGRLLTAEPGQFEVLQQRNVPVVAAWAGKDVATQIPEHPRLVVGKE